MADHFSTSESMADQVQVLFHAFIPTSAIKCYTLYSALYEPSANVSVMRIPSQEPDQPALIDCISNGLVCFANVEGLFLWNPVLRKIRHLPRPSFSARDARQVHGIGYDESNDDYKVVFVDSVKQFPSDDETEVKVYSLLTDSWRTIDNCMGGFSLNGLGKYTNGNIHWAATSSSQEWKIVSFDMASEKSGELLRPDYDAGVSGWVIGLSGGKLVVLYDYENKKADLWVMDKYGVEESWSRAVSIPYNDVHPSVPYSFYHVICILRDGEIVVMSEGSKLLVYHSKHKEFRDIMIDGGSSVFESHVYIESLVDPSLPRLRLTP